MALGVKGSQVQILSARQCLCRSGSCWGYSGRALIACSGGLGPYRCADRGDRGREPPDLLSLAWPIVNTDGAWGAGPVSWLCPVWSGHSWKPQSVELDGRPAISRAVVSGSWRQRQAGTRMTRSAVAWRTASRARSWRRWRPRWSACWLPSTSISTMPVGSGWQSLRPQRQCPTTSSARTVSRTEPQPQPHRAATAALVCPSRRRASPRWGSVAAACGGGRWV